MTFWRRRISNHWRHRRRRRDGHVAAAVLVELLLGRQIPPAATRAR